MSPMMSLARCLAGAALLAMCATAVRAGENPEARIAIDMRSRDASRDCASLRDAYRSCSDITTSLPVAGEFDAVVVVFNFNAITGVEFTLEWPAGWVIDEFTSCGDLMIGGDVRENPMVTLLVWTAPIGSPGGTSGVPVGILRGHAASAGCIEVLGPEEGRILAVTSETYAKNHIAAWYDGCAGVGAPADPCVAPEVTANFDATPRAGVVPLTVAFTDQSSGPIIGWFWNFGDGDTGTEMNPAHTYTLPGTYAVRLRVATASGVDDTLRSALIHADPVPVGACCGPSIGACSIRTEADCIAFGGEYQGDGTPCTPGLCGIIPVGACCGPSPGSCSIRTQAECVAAGGEYQGDGSACDPGLCGPVPMGACCGPDPGVCTVRTQTECVMSGGMYRGDGTTCVPGLCDTPAGACCGPEPGACRITSQADCIAAGGVYRGDGSPCTTEICDPTPCNDDDTPGRVVSSARNMGAAMEPVFQGHQLTPDRDGPRLLYAPSENDDAAYRAAMAAQVGGSCDYYDARFGTPSADLLEHYDCVMTWANYAYDDNVCFGDRLADFVDAGGNVVLGAFCAYTSGNFLSGRIMSVTSRYCPVRGGLNHFSMAPWDGSDADCCVHTGITAYGSTYRDYLALISGNVCGRFTDGEIANAINNAGDVVYANGAGGYPLFPSGQDAARAANGCLCGGAAAIESSTWGALKRLFR